MAGFGIYVHWPFCAQKCPYCDFNSHVRTDVDERGWAEAITHELAWIADWQGEVRPRVESIFFGGGTPSLMQGKSIANILDCIARHWSVADDAEITLESNPASADATRFRDYRAAGVNRLSLGVQALNDADLKQLGRLHNAADAKQALALAMSVFDRVSLDLIYARPHQTADAWRAELREALAFGTEHLSLYQLTIEPATPFAQLHRAGALQIPDDDTAAALYDITQELTKAEGRPAYEISNHARPGAESRHNLLYWRYGAYAGVGPGAHGRIERDGIRYATACEKLPERWRERVRGDGQGFAEFTPIAPEDAAHEHLLMAMRLAEGLDIADWRARWKSELDMAQLDTLLANRLVAWNGRRIAATQQGRLVLNSVIAALAA